MALSDANKALAKWQITNGKASIKVGNTTYYLTAGTTWSVTTTPASGTVFEELDGNAIVNNKYLKADGSTSDDVANALLASTTQPDAFSVPSSVACLCRF